MSLNKESVGERHSTTGNSFMIAQGRKKTRSSRRRPQFALDATDPSEWKRTFSAPLCIKSPEDGKDQIKPRIETFACS